MAAPKHKIPPSEPPASNSIFLFVSLYLVMLAFFILLNTISKVERKKQTDAFKSLSETFSPGTDDAIPYIQGLGNFGGELSATHFFGPVGKLAKEMISLSDADIIETGNTMVLRIPAGTFYVQGSPEIQAKQRAFMNTLADELTKLGDKATITLQMSIGLAGDGSDQTAVQLPIMRAGNFARVLTSMGVSENAVYVGVIPGANPDVIEMKFTANPKQTHKQTPF
jgi:hypothetical protein